MARSRKPRDVDRSDRKAAERRAVIDQLGLNAWTMPGRREPNRKAAASKAACRRPADRDD
jgi:hypothetical protein